MTNFQTFRPVLRESLAITLPLGLSTRGQMAPNPMSTNKDGKNLISWKSRREIVGKHSRNASENVESLNFLGHHNLQMHTTAKV